MEKEVHRTHFRIQNLSKIWSVPKSSEFEPTSCPTSVINFIVRWYFFDEAMSPLLFRLNFRSKCIILSLNAWKYEHRDLTMLYIRRQQHSTERIVINLAWLEQFSYLLCLLLLYFFIFQIFNHSKKCFEPVHCHQIREYLLT